MGMGGWIWMRRSAYDAGLGEIRTLKKMIHTSYKLLLLLAHSKTVQTSQSSVYM